MTTRTLGRRIDFEGVSLDPNHVSALLEYPRPENKKAIQRWCCLLAWIELDIPDPDVSRVNAPIAAQMGRDECRWSAACEAAFQDMKSLMRDAVENNQKQISMRQEEMAHPSSRPIHLSKRPVGEGPKNDHSGKHLFLATDTFIAGYGGGLHLGENWWNAKPLGFFSKKYRETCRPRACRSSSLASMAHSRD